MFIKFYILFSLTIYLFIETFLSNYDAFSLYDKISIILIISSILIIQYISCLLIYSRDKKKSVFIVNVLCAIFLFLNSSLIFTIFLKDFHSTHFSYKTLILFSIFCISFFLFWFQERINTFKKVLFISSTALCIYSGFFVYKYFEEYNVKFDDKINLTKFTEHPNIYFINLDSMQTRGTVLKNLGTSIVPHDDYLNSKNFFLFKNSFADFFGTAHSIASLMKLDPNYYHELHNQIKKINPYKNLFFKVNNWKDITKKLNNPLNDLLKFNGYNITFLLENNYFGNKPFKGVDTWKESLPLSICEQLKYDYRNKIAFFGYCNYLMNFISKEINYKNLQNFDRIFSISKIIKLIFKGNVNLQYSEYSDFINKNISLALNKSERNFFYIHNNLPGHANGSYPTQEYKDVFKKQFIERSKKSVVFLDSIFSHIKLIDKNPVIFVFGDHGLMLAASFSTREISEKLDFYINDIFSIRAAIYPNNFCVKKRNELSKRKFNTLSSITTHILECLSENKKIMASKENNFYKINTNLYPKLSKLIKDKYITSEDLKYENFIYE